MPVIDIGESSLFSVFERKKKRNVSKYQIFTSLDIRIGLKIFTVMTKETCMFTGRARNGTIAVEMSIVVHSKVSLVA